MLYCLNLHEAPAYVLVGRSTVSTRRRGRGGLFNFILIIVCIVTSDLWNWLYHKLLIGT